MGISDCPIASAEPKLGSPRPAETVLPLPLEGGAGSPIAALSDVGDVTYARKRCPSIHCGSLYVFGRSDESPPIAIVGD